MLNIALIIMTHGRQDCIQPTITSAETALGFDRFSVRMIIDDSADDEYTGWLYHYYNQKFEIWPTSTSLGFCGSIQRAWDLLKKHEIDYVFHLEDDFLFNEVIHFGVMIEILKKNNYLAQIALLRQPCNPSEVKAGGVIHLYPEDFTEKEKDGQIWTEHGRFFTTNPCLYPRKIIDQPYPQAEFCEGKFSIQLRMSGYKFAYLGRKNQKPKVKHIGGRTAKHWKWV